MSDQKARIPNLFVVGAMKSATTSLHNYLDMHPDIFMTKNPWKEPSFFVEEANWKKGLGWYLSLFEAATTEKYWGESSTDYTKSPNFSGIPERIHTHSPNAKIIYIMRDPIERAISQYWWEVQYTAEGRKMPQAIMGNSWILNASNYALQLRPYLDLFGIQNVLTLTMEELQVSPHDTLKKVFSWLEVDSEQAIAAEYKSYNRSANEVNRVMGSGILSQLKETKFWQLIKIILPISPKFKKRLRRMLSKPVVKNENDREETVKLLQPIMQEQVEELSKLLGKEFPEWKTLHGND